MRDILSIIVLAAISIGASSAQRDSRAPPRRDLLGKQFDAIVTRVADGDTLEATAAGDVRTLRLRLQGIDAPELGEVFSREAQTHLRTLVLAKPVRVSVTDIDRYGRLVVRVNVAGTDASSALLRAGLACHAYARDAALAHEESQARAAGIGFWAPTAKKPACVTATSFSGRPADPSRVSAAAPIPSGKAGVPSSTKASAGKSAQPAATRSHQYRGNVSSGIYHTSMCPNFTCRNCTRLFATVAEAKAAGFRPAGDCAQ